MTAAPNKALDSWLLVVEKWLEEVQTPRRNAEPTTEQAILQILWQRFYEDLRNNLRRTAVVTDIPLKGGILVFAGGLSTCIVVQYEFATEEPSLKPVAVITDPKSAFDVWTAVDLADASAKNILKHLLVAGHKLVAHRGVLVHVDRRSEASVFGPSIDTLLLAEILAQAYFESVGSGGAEPLVAFDVGAGSGFLAAGLLRHLSALEELFCVDVDPSSISCTSKNLQIATLVPNARQVKTRLITGPFDPTLLNRRFDLIVCNPPYIPVPEYLRGDPTLSSPFAKATSGLDLMIQVLTEAPSLLATRGRLFLMVSSVSLEAALGFVPEGWVVDRPLGDEGYEVLFDVDHVLNQPRWLEYLLSKGVTEAAPGVYSHRLHPLVVSRPGDE